MLKRIVFLMGIVLLILSFLSCEIQRKERVKERVVVEEQKPPAPPPPKPKPVKKHPRARYQMATWYGPGLQGKDTASGDDFDMKDLTAAHKTLPIGTTIRVTNPKTKKSVEVVINDKGPVVRGVQLDLSYAAAKQIGLVKKGRQRVKVEVLKFPDEDDSKKEAVEKAKSEQQSKSQNSMQQQSTKSENAANKNGNSGK